MKLQFTKCLLALPAVLLSLTQNADALMLQGNIRYEQPGATLAANLQEQTSLQHANMVARAQILNGVWRCDSVVVASTVPGVAPGVRVSSQVAYTTDSAGRIIETSAEDGWSTTTAPAVNLTADTIVVQRTSQNGSPVGMTKAQCVDRMKIESPNKLTATSEVRQFMNGQYVGQYETRSVLSKL